MRGATRAALLSAARSIKDKLFFFGGYQRTQANTGFVPTASSITVLPQALQLISGARTKENLFAAFCQTQPRHHGFRSQTPMLGSRCIRRRRQVAESQESGDRGLHHSRAARGRCGRRHRRRRRRKRRGQSIYPSAQCFPGGLQAGPVHDQARRAAEHEEHVERHVLLLQLPGFDPFPDPLSLASPVTLKRNDRNRTLAISDVHIFRPAADQRGAVRLFLPEQYSRARRSIPWRSPTNRSEFRTRRFSSIKGPGTLRLGHYVGRPGTILERFSFGGPNDTFNRREQKTYSFRTHLIVHPRRRILALWGRSSSAHSFNTRASRRAGDRVREV